MTAMELRVFTEPQQGATYDDLLAVARRPRSSASGRSSAPTTTSAMGGDGLPGPSDAWVTLAGLARETSTIRLGTLMTSATFRLPGPAGDHRRRRRPDERRPGRARDSAPAGTTPSTRRTASRSRAPGSGSTVLEEQLAIITGLWASDGELLLRRRRTTGSRTRPALPKPAQAAAAGARSAAAARSARRRWPPRYADEFNLPFVAVRGRACAQNDRVRRACEAIGRDPGEPALLQRAGALRRRRRGGGPPPGRRRSARTSTTCARTTSAAPSAEVVDKIGRYAESGQTRLYLQTLDLAGPRPPAPRGRGGHAAGRRPLA